MLRPTKSPVIYIQSTGRGGRIADGKDHCLVLDFAGNTTRLGPINDVQIEQKKPGKGGGVPIVKVCPDCGVYLAPAVRICDVCDHEFVFGQKITMEASTAEIVADDAPLEEWV